MEKRLLLNPQNHEISIKNQTWEFPRIHTHTPIRRTLNLWKQPYRSVLTISSRNLPDINPNPLERRPQPLLKDPNLRKQPVN